MEKCDSMEKCAKEWKSAGEHGKVRESMGKCWISRRNRSRLASPVLPFGRGRLFRVCSLRCVERFLWSGQIQILGVVESPIAWKGFFGVVKPRFGVWEWLNPPLHAKFFLEWSNPDSGSGQIPDCVERFFGVVKSRFGGWEWLNPSLHVKFFLEWSNPCSGFDQPAPSCLAVFCAAPFPRLARTPKPTAAVTTAAVTTAAMTNRRRNAAAMPPQCRRRSTGQQGRGGALRPPRPAPIAETGGGAGRGGASDPRAQHPAIGARSESRLGQSPAAPGTGPHLVQSLGDRAPAPCPRCLDPRLSPLARAAVRTRATSVWSPQQPEVGGLARPPGPRRARQGLARLGSTGIASDPATKSAPSAYRR